MTILGIFFITAKVGESKMLNLYFFVLLNLCKRSVNKLPGLYKLVFSKS